MLVVAGVSVVSYSLEQFAFYRELSVISSSVYETASPLLLPMNVFSEFQFLVSFGIVFLAFDFVSRDKRARLDEVISTLPLTNVQLVFGRALGISMLFYLVIAGFICSYYLLGIICEFALPTTGFRRPELTSTIATLVLDVFPYLLFWTSTVMLVTVFVRFRAIAATVSIALMILFFWLQNNAPMFSNFFWGLSVLNSQLPSEIAPIFPSSLLTIQRISLVLLAFVLLYVVAKSYPRRDQTTSAGYLIPGILLFALWYGGTTFVSSQHSNPFDERRDFYTAHEAHANSPDIDAIAMNGTIDLDPGSDIVLNIDLELLVKEPVDPLVLSLNPGYEIERVELSGEPITYAFENGLLLVQTQSLPNEAMSHLLTIRAKGNLNTNFVDLENASASLLTRDETKRELVVYGTHASINHKNYVALLPAVAWYPIPGSHLQRDTIQSRPRDYFELDLSVSAPANWYVGGPGKASIEGQNEKNVFSFAPKRPVHQVALFASDFERRSTEIDGIEFELLVSATNTNNIDLFTPIVEDLKTEISRLIGHAEELGLDYPFDGFSVIEVPNYLHTFKQSAHMPSTRTQPGMFLLREGKFLSAPFHSAIQPLYEDSNLTDSEKRERHLSYLLSYFRNDVSGGSAFTAAANNLFAYQTHPRGRGAETISFVIDYLMLKLLDIEGGFHSAYILEDADFAELTEISARNIVSSSNRNTLGDLLYSAFANRPDVWESLLHGYQDADSDSTPTKATHHHSQFLLAAQIGELLLDKYGVDQVSQLLATLSDGFQGDTFSYADLIAIAQSLEIPLDEVMDLWFDGVRPAGFRTSAAKVVRLPDATDGTPMYESNLFVENAEPNEGFFKLQFATELQGTTSAFEFDSTDPIELAGNSSVEIAIQTSKPLTSMWLRPYLSLNRETFKIPIERQRQIRNESRPPKPFAMTVNWSVDEGDSVLIDDLDSGFTVDAAEDEPFFKFDGFSLISYSSTSNGMDAGLKSAGGFSYLSEHDWMRQQADTAFGRYRKTFVRAESFDSTPMAHFRADIPKAGRWKLEYHLPDVSDPSGREVGGWGRYQILLNERNNWGDFVLQLRVGNVERPIEFNGEIMQAGWNDLGTFELPNQTVILSISSDTEFGTTVIDAIRWTPVETQNDSI